MVIYNAEIHTLDENNTVYKNGFIEFAEKILRIGDMSDCPDLTRFPKELLIDAQNRQRLFPGFVDSHSHVGVWGNAEGIEGDDGNETTDPCTPHLRAIDMVNPTDRCFREAAEAGVTTVVCGPGSANPIGGQFLALKTAGSPRIDERVLKEPTAIKFAFGENPKMVYRERSEAPVTRMATAAIIREQLFKTKRYLEAVEKAEGELESEPPDYDMKCEALLHALPRESDEENPKLPIHAHAHRADDIFTAIRIAREFDLQLTILHGTDAAQIADELAAADVPVIIGPVICDRGKPELAGHTIGTAAVLAEKGVRFAIASDHPVVPVQYLPLSAGLAIRGGLDAQTALRAITIEAARLSGLDGRVGSLERGKDADIVMISDKSGEFYDVSAVPTMVFIDGELI